MSVHDLIHSGYFEFISTRVARNQGFKVMVQATKFPRGRCEP